MIKVDENDPVGELEPTFPYRDVTIKRGVNMAEFYDLEGEIGRGKFGTVFKCREKGTNLTLAAKFVKIDRRQDRRNVEREVEIMKTLQHPRLIQLYDAFETDNIMCVVLELIEGGELFERVIDDDFVLTEKACTVFMRQICEGVAFIHSYNIIHLDLKPENILCLTKTGNRIKIIDFGLARKFEPDKKLQVLFGTPEFVAPEVVNFDQISCATDMWSVGVICYVLLSGLSPFMGETDVETMANVTIARYDFEDDSFDEISPEAKDFISRLLVKDKEARLTAVECLSHPWLRRQIPPPPPALDTTKDNLRNYVEKCQPIISHPKIIENDFHNKPGLIENIIANEQKAIHSHSMPISDKREIPVHPITNECLPQQNIINSDKSWFPPANHQCVSNDKNHFIAKNQDLKTAVKNEENNIKNSNLMNKVPFNKPHPPAQIMSDKSFLSKDQNNPASQNIFKLMGNTHSVEVESKEMPSNNKPLGTQNKITPSNENTIKNDINFSLNSSALVSSNESTVSKLPGKTLEMDSADNKSKAISNDPKQYENPIESKMSVPSEVQKSQLKIETPLPLGGCDRKQKIEQNFNSNNFFKRTDETNMHFSSNKHASSTSTIPKIVYPSVSTTHVQSTSSDFSFINNKNDEAFSKKCERAFVSDFMKNSENVKLSNERIVSISNSNESQFREAVNSKECDPFVFKQHLRATPPWFSELKNQTSKQSSGDRFDRRSSDFSCFLNSKEDSESLNLADEIRKLSARLLQMTNSQNATQSPPVGTFNTNCVRPRHDPITCFLENHGIPHPRPKFKFSCLNRDVPIGSPPPPSNVSYYLNIGSKKDKKDSHSAPESPRASPEKPHETSKTSVTGSSTTSNFLITKEKSQHVSQEKTSSMSSLEHVQINKTNNKLSFPV